MQRRLALATLAGLASTTLVRSGFSATPINGKSQTPWIRKTLKINMIQVKGSLEDKFSAAKAAGFEGVEVNVPLSGMSVKDIAEAAEATGILVDGSVGGTHWQVRHSDPDAAVRKKALDNLILGLEQTAALGGDSCLLVVGHGKDGTPQEVTERTIANIKQALPTAERLKVQILIENVWNHFLYDHAGDSTQSAQPLADYVDAFESPWVGLQFDLGNHWKYGDVADWVRVLGKRIKKLDIKGFSRETNRFTKVTEGDVDWPAIEAALREIGFTGWCAAEVGGGGPERLQEIATNMESALNCTKPLQAEV
ncbi:MAG: sugar phosphate isomerase/epimerase family protein [Planctomycetota bacterium]